MTLGALVLAGCTVQPLYGGVAGESLRAELSAISILPVDDRIGQIVRNELLFALTGGGTPSAPRYELTLAVSAGGGSFDVTADANARSTGVSVTAVYLLAEIGTGAVIAQGTARAETHYTISNQEFANVRAEDDARQRAAEAVAEDVRLAILAALAAV